MTNENVLRIEDELYGGYATVSNPVSDFWDIELCLYKDSNESYIFIVKFTSKLPIELPNGQIITQSKEIREVDFEDKERMIRKELRKIGMINNIIFHGIKDYVEYLKLNKQYQFYGTISEQLEIGDNENKRIKDESTECYEVLQLEIQDNPEFFPTSTTEFKVGVSEGMFLPNYKQNGYPVVVIEGEKLQNIINVVGKTEFEDLIKCWRELGLLLSGGGERPQTYI